MGWRGGNGNETLHLWAQEERSEGRLHLHTDETEQEKTKGVKKNKNK